MTALASLFLAVASLVLSPLVELAVWNKREKQRIIEELDHASIRESVSILVQESFDGVIDQQNWPDALAATKPTFVQTAGKFVIVDYGGGFEHFGLIFSFGGNTPEDARKLGEGIYYYAGE